MSDERSESERMEAEQARRAALEAELAGLADGQAEAQAHARRAEKAEYLREALEQRAESERDDGPPQ